MEPLRPRSSRRTRSRARDCSLRRQRPRAIATYRGASPQGRLFREGVIVAVAMSALAFGVCLLTNAPPDFSRVFYVAEALCDLVLVADAAWLAQALAHRVRPAVAA